MMKSFFKAIGLSVFAALIAVPAFAQGPFDKTADWGGPDSPPQRGNIKVAGEVEYDAGSGTFILRGNGDDIWENNDEGFMVYTELEGSWSLSARVYWNEPGSNDWSKVGVMVREDGADAESRHYWIELRGAGFGDQVDAQWRDSTGGSSGNTQIFEDDGATGVADYANEGVWLRVTRVASEDLFYSEWSYDGENWTVGHSQTQTDWPDTAAFGLTITSHVDDDFLVEARVDDVKITAAPPVGVRAVSPPTFSPGTEHSVEITLINESDSAIDMSVEETPPTGFAISNISDGGTESGGTISWSINAAPGTTTLSYSLAAPADASTDTPNSFTGTSGAVETTGTNTLTYLNVLPAPDGDPIFTGHLDVFDTAANLGAEGDATYADGEYEVVGSGNDIWNTGDNFHFLFKEMSGNFIIKADTLLDVGNGDGTWAKAGPMIRDNLTAGSPYAFSMIRNQGQDFSPQWRDSQGSGANYDDSLILPGAEHDTTVGLERTGDNVIYFYEDTSGNRVDYLDRDFPAFNDPVVVGLAVTAHSAGALSFGLFTEVSIEQTADVSEWSLY